MKTKYDVWIRDNVAKSYGTCADVTETMAAEFPELSRVRGHYYCPIWGERAHWWLVDPDGAIVDPTGSQFPSNGIGEYVPWNEGDPEPTGKCPNCNGYVYDGSTCCGERCHAEYVAFCLSERQPWITELKE